MLDDFAKIWFTISNPATCEYLTAHKNQNGKTRAIYVTATNRHKSYAEFEAANQVLTESTTFQSPNSVPTTQPKRVNKQNHTHVSEPERLLRPLVGKSTVESL
jgi:hypothetical protein